MGATPVRAVRGDDEERRMMANPEMSSTQEPGLAAVPPQGRPADAAAAPEMPRASSRASSSDPANDSPNDPSRGPARVPSRAPAYEPEPERMPLMARVLLADLAVAVVALVVLFVIEVQRFGDASLHLRRQAWGEDLVVLFGVSVLFGVVAFLLIRSGHLRVAIVQAVVTALVLAAAVTSAATGDPKPTPDTSVPISTPGHPG